MEGAPFGFTPRARFFEERLVAEDAHALLDRHILAVKTDADNEAAQPDQRLGKLTEANRVIVFPEAFLDHHLLAVVGPPFDQRGRRKQNRLPQLGVDLAEMLIVKAGARERLWQSDRTH